MGCNIVYAPNELNQYTQVDGNPVTHDANGNLTGHEGWVYTYDAHNRLDTAEQGATLLDLDYDPSGRLVSTGTHQYSYDDGILPAVKVLETFYTLSSRACSLL